ncbi:hypothetical protein PVAG01_06217 [Phlyctema vagabunda]|uniref:Uncharacterized protein n=1 Tax=Phlyctema vagabunda TaxID=108571 RepID=A0ABR4PGC0_9HELO
MSSTQTETETETASSPTKTHMAQRPSRFIEGAPLTRTPTSNELFFNILSEMDEFEAARARKSKNSSHRGSASSADSSTEVTNTMRFHEDEKMNPRVPFDARRQRQSFDVFTSRWAPVEQDVQEGIEKAAKLGQKVKGRLRALTANSGTRDQVKMLPYPGT